MKVSDLLDLRPGEVVTHISTGSRYTVVSPPVPSRVHGHRVEVRSGFGRSFITVGNADLWNRDAEYDRQQHVQQDSKRTNGRGKARGSTRRKNGAESKEIDNPWIAISRFRLSIAELIQLQKELNSVRAFVRRRHDEEFERYKTNHDALENKKRLFTKKWKANFQKASSHCFLGRTRNLRRQVMLAWCGLFSRQKRSLPERARDVSPKRSVRCTRLCGLSNGDVLNPSKKNLKNFNNPG